VEVEEKDLSVPHDAVRLADVRLALAKRFDLGAGENDAGLPGIENVVVVSSALVSRDRLDLIGLGGVSGHVG
jgi:hypothetical protein